MSERDYVQMPEEEGSKQSPTSRDTMASRMGFLVFRMPIRKTSIDTIGLMTTISLKDSVRTES